jgi:hypothetical protein
MGDPVPHQAHPLAGQDASGGDLVVALDAVVFDVEPDHGVAVVGGAKDDVGDGSF